MDIKQQLKIHEGTIGYQKLKGYYHSGKFWTYKDSLGYATIGYGHLVQKHEDYSEGLSEEQADILLDGDIAIAKSEVLKLGLTLPADSRWNDFLVMMVFQLGLPKTLQFRKFLSALKSKNYATAISEVKNSNWYRQTPSRVDSMIDYVFKG